MLKETDYEGMKGKIPRVHRWIMSIQHDSLQVWDEAITGIHVQYQRDGIEPITLHRHAKIDPCNPTDHLHKFFVEDHADDPYLGNIQ